MENPKLSVIIAVRSHDNIDVLERLLWKRIPHDVETIVVDDGSADADKIERLCEGKSWKYVYLHTEDAPFSLSRSRNAGIKASTAEYIYFEDVDFLHKSNFYDRLIEVAQHLGEVPFNFAAIPTLFLTQQASTGLLDKISDEQEFDRQIDDYVARLQFLNPDEPNEICESFAPVGSNVFLRRDQAFHVGLFDEYFNSWGGEDRDFVFRLLAHNSFLHRPAHFHATKKWKIHRTNAYEGWRSAYRLHGDWMAKIGMYAVHIHHPENGWKDPYARAANFAYAEGKATEIGQGKRKLEPSPIPMQPLNLFIGRNPVFFNDEVMKALGSVKVIEPNHHVDPNDFANTIVELSPERVFFQNPYGSPWLLSVWRSLRGSGLRCVCAERGGLPWSIYFDEGGFCCESSSYGPEHWQSASPLDAKAYIEDLKDKSQFLEPQGSRSIEDVRQALDTSKKTLLVLLQSLTDATTLHFTSPLPDYAAFLDAVRGLNDLQEFNVLVKNHPLNKQSPLPGVGTSVDDCPIYDLYDIADVVLTLNSGAGLLALGYGVPVITMGTSFYTQAGLAMPASSVDEIKANVLNPQYDRNSVNRFYGYLINEFYSFATWSYGSRDYSDKTKMSTMAEVRYQKLRVAGLSIDIKRRKLDPYSLIMDPYAMHTFLAKRGQLSTTATTNFHRAAAATALSEVDNFSVAAAAFYSGRYTEAASKFDELAATKPSPKLYRAAAEAYDRAGNTAVALDRLRAAAKIAQNKSSITRRIREMERHPTVRKVARYFEKPYPIQEH